ncbi:hypothetical protein [Promicromonospora sukumoe]|uniref:hypothetical protein n=1 Tax=Promicromonospora sukumoe TaxID=88382 RepID=UPI00037B90B6|nr:hypothetical protein [Promicromonospora sukumoe]
MPRISNHRRYTRNHTWHLDVAGWPLFVKANPNRAEARQELTGHAAIEAYYPIPALRWAGSAGPWAVHVFDRSLHRDEGGSLLVDEISRAETTNDRARLDMFLDDILTYYRDTLLSTARHIPARRVVGKLYGDRLRTSGRVDQYYGRCPPWPLRSGEVVPAGLRMEVNGRPHMVDLPSIVERLRADFAADRRVWAAISQGDPTDFNIGWSPRSGPVWFDYDTGGLNAVAGEFACFLMYQVLHGAWLTPRYNRDAFDDHPEALHSSVFHRPRIYTEQSDTGLAITYAFDPGAVRTHVVGRYLTEVVRPVAEALGVRDLWAWLRPYLIARVLGVYDITRLDGPDVALSLALLAQLADDDVSPTVPFPCFATTSTGAPR